MTPVQDTFLTMNHLTYRTKWSAKTIRRYIKQGKFPAPIPIGRRKRWSAAVFEEWIAKKAKESNAINNAA